MNKKLALQSLRPFRRVGESVIRFGYVMEKKKSFRDRSKYYTLFNVHFNGLMVKYTVSHHLNHKIECSILHFNKLSIY